jgi:D-alanyl-D-alanine carboxypeptidase
MVQKNKKKLRKIIVITAAALLLLTAITAVIAVNADKLFVFGEKNGIFKKNIELYEVEFTYKTTLEELTNDSRVRFDQSMMLVNTLHTLSEDFEPQVSEYKSTTVYMNDCMLDAYARLSADISKKFRQKLYVSSDFRSADEQAALYEKDPLTATLPGASEHQTGLALDVYVAYFSGDGFIKSPVGRFINRNSWKYGFIIRYPAHAEDITGIRFEPWHIRYVGHPHADIIYNNHLTLEEYVQTLELGKWYEVGEYYICRTELSAEQKIAFPSDFTSCTVSSDNTGSVIITVRK